jgi:hypothetical protein
MCLCNLIAICHSTKVETARVQQEKGRGLKERHVVKLKLKEALYTLRLPVGLCRRKENAVTFWFNWTTIDARSISNSTPSPTLPSSQRVSASNSRLPLIPWSNLWGGELITSKEEETGAAYDEPLFIFIWRGGRNKENWLIRPPFDDSLSGPSLEMWEFSQDLFTSAETPLMHG